MYEMTVKYKDETEWGSRNYDSVGQAMSRFLATKHLQKNVKEVVIKEQD